MTIEKLAKYCLQALEQDAETDVMSSSMQELESVDTFAEYIKNMEHSIYMGLVRFATSLILPVKEILLPKGINTLELTETRSNGNREVKLRIFHKIKEVYAMDSDGNIVKQNCSYYLIGNKVVIKDYNKDYTYSVIYHPTINDLTNYTTALESSIWNIELNDLGVPDEMAINIKFLVYSDMKLEENPSVANINKNYFESYLSEMATTQVVNVQTEVVLNDWSDVYGD